MYNCRYKIAQNDKNPSRRYVIYYTMYYTFNLISHGKDAHKVTSKMTGKIKSDNR